MVNENWVRENVKKTYHDNAKKEALKRAEWEKGKKITAVKDESLPRTVRIKYE